MSRFGKNYLEQLGLDHETYKELRGINTRSRVATKQDTPAISQKTQQKKKAATRKQPYIPPQVLQLAKPVLIEYPLFKSLVQDLKPFTNQTPQQYMDCQILYSIYEQIFKRGGVVEVSSINGFTQIVKDFMLTSDPSKIYHEFNAQFIQKIRRFLFSIQFINKNSAQKKIYQLGLVNFVSKQQLYQNSKNKLKGLNYFNYDLTLFQEGAEAINVDKSIFNLDHMCTHYHKQKIDIRIQNPLDYGFKPSKLKNKKYEMTLGQYRFYQLNFLDDQVMKNFKHSDQLGKGQVFFGVNFQPSDQMLNRQMKKSVQDTFLDFHGDFDLMSYLDTDVPGCSLPQMYFKTPGCWTGGHQQNICMSALNINHGPGYSQWYTLDVQYVPNLRKQLLQKFNTDLYLSQGLWYEKLDWFISRGYPVKRFLQRKDDIVVTGPGTLHWVRSFGLAIQTSWNIFPKNYSQFLTAFQRHKINQQINFPKSDTIPLKSLILKYLNHQHSFMENETLNLCVNKLQQWLEQEVTLLSELPTIQKHMYFYLKDLQSFCCLCRQQVLVYFLPAPPEHQKGISCLKCNKIRDKNKSVIKEIYNKIDVFWLQTLINLCKNQKLNKLHNEEFTQLCRGHHVGKLPIKCKTYQKYQQEEAIFDLFKFNDNQQIKNAQRQVFYDSQSIYQLYESFLKDLVLAKTSSENRKNSKFERLKPSKVVSCKMMMNEDTQMKTQIKQKLQKIDVQCQTLQMRVNQVTKQKQLGQISEQSRSRSKSKKKKKEKKQKKSKKKKEKKEKIEQDGSPRFKTQSDEEHKVRGSSPNKSDYRQQNRDDDNHGNNYNRNNFGGDNGYGNRSRNRNYNNEQGGGSDRFGNNERGNGRGRGRGNWGNRDRQGGWNDRGGFNNNYNENNQQEQHNQMGRKRNFNQYNNSRNFEDGGGRGDRGRGRGGRGGRGDRGGRGRGGGFRNNYNSDRNQPQNQDNNNNQDFENKGFTQQNQNKSEVPDEY